MHLEYKNNNKSTNIAFLLKIIKKEKHFYKDIFYNFTKKTMIRIAVIVSSKINRDSNFF